MQLTFHMLVWTPVSLFTSVFHPHASCAFLYISTMAQNSINMTDMKNKTSILTNVSFFMFHFIHLITWLLCQTILCPSSALLLFFSHFPIPLFVFCHNFSFIFGACVFFLASEYKEVCGLLLWLCKERIESNRTEVFSHLNTWGLSLMLMSACQHAQNDMCPCWCLEGNNHIHHSLVL